MNEQDLLDALAQTDEALLTEAEQSFHPQTKKKTVPLRRIILPAAASFAVLIAGAAVLKSGILTKTDPKPVTPIPVKEVYEIGSEVTEPVGNTEIAVEWEDTPTAIGETVDENGIASSSGNSPIGDVTPEVNFGLEEAVSNGVCLRVGEEQITGNEIKIITKADAGEHPAADVLTPEDGEVLVTPAVRDTVENHKGEDVYFRIKIELTHGQPTNGEYRQITQQDMLAESDRLSDYCRQNGFDNCVFCVDTFTWSDDGTVSTPGYDPNAPVTQPSPQTNVRHTLYALSATAQLIENFPASPNYGYVLSFPEK